jgi:hypothetical protein
MDSFPTANIGKSIGSARMNKITSKINIELLIQVKRRGKQFSHSVSLDL